MTFDVTIAALADWLPKFDPPFGDNGFTKPYKDRLKLQLIVDDAETLASVYRRAIEHWQPQVSADSHAHPHNLMHAIYWFSFYLPEDEASLQLRYESPTQLILIDEEGRARWNLSMEKIPYGHLVRAGEQGLLRGDPLRPYLPMLLPQGSTGFQVGWETLLTTWRKRVIFRREKTYLGRIPIRRGARRHTLVVFRSGEPARPRRGDPDLAAQDLLSELHHVLCLA